MVTLFNTQVIIGDNHIIPAHNRTDNGAWWQLDIINLAANHFRR